MTIDLKEFNELKSHVERLQRMADKAQGALEQTMNILKDDFECDSIEEAEELAKEYGKEADKLEAKFGKANGDFTEKWGSKLE